MGSGDPFFPQSFSVSFHCHGGRENPWVGSPWSPVSECECQQEAETLFKVISGLGVQESRRSDPPSNPKRESWFLDFFGSPQGLQPLYPLSPLLMNTCSVVRKPHPYMLCPV